MRNSALPDGFAAPSARRRLSDYPASPRGLVTPAAASPNSRLVVPASAPLIAFRPYQRDAFFNRENGIEVWLWGRQTGKSFTLAAWCVDRLITIPGRTVTVLSNSKFNGRELNLKCAQICDLMGRAFEQVDLSPDGRFEKMAYETRVTVNGKLGRILILAANPRTARGFTGDLALDEFAFQEDGAGIWNEASPTLEANPDFLCRIASTANGKHNQFYRMATDPRYPLRKVTRTEAYKQGCKIFHPVTRQEIDPVAARNFASNKRAYDQNFECAFEDENMALLTYDLIAAAEREDVGKICEGNWSREALACIDDAPRGAIWAGSHSGVPPSAHAGEIDGMEPRKPARDWIATAADPDAMHRLLLMDVCHGSIDRLHLLLTSNAAFRLSDRFDADSFQRFCVEATAQQARAKNGAFSPGNVAAERMLFAGVDVGRNVDRTVVTVIERIGSCYLVRGILRLENMRLPFQQIRLEELLSRSSVRSCKIDMTGLGLGLCEYTQFRFGSRVQGVNFATTVPASSLPAPVAESRPQPAATARITEVLATALLQAFEDRAIQIPADQILREDLRKPERFVSPSGRVSIAATRDEAGHADHFWSMALALSAAQTPIQPPLEYHAWKPKPRHRMPLL